MLYGKIEKATYSVSDFIEWQSSGLLELSPSFQRRNVWSKPAKSYLIDTIIKEFPIPIIFLRHKKPDTKTFKQTKEVVDGQQRIRTVLAYVKPNCLKDHNPSNDNFVISKAHNEEFGGRRYGELPDKIKSRILEYRFSVHIFPSEIEDSEVFQLFARMNSTGVKVNDQELRNAIYFGNFKILMLRMSAKQLNRWREWEIFTESQLARMKEVELVSEFALYMLKGLTGKTQKSLDKLYEYYEEREASELTIIESRFEKVMQQIDKHYGQQMSDSSFRKMSTFYALFCVVYSHMYGVSRDLRRRVPVKLLPTVFTRNAMALSKKIENNSLPESVKNGLARRTTNIDSRKIVFGHFRSALGLS